MMSIVHIFYDTGTDFSYETVQIIAHTLPSGLQAVNGSDNNGNCVDRNNQPNGLRVCEDPNGIFGGSILYACFLVDGTTPNLDFSDDNWAEGFFTVSRNYRTTIELGFELDINDNITRVELESLECPDRGIGAPIVSLYGMEDPDPVGIPFPTFGSGTTTLLDTVTPEATSCSVQTHTFCIPIGEQPYRYYYLVFTFSNSDVDWLFLAEVRFLVYSSTPTTTTVTPGPSATSIALSTSPQSSALESSTVPTTTPPSRSGGEPMATIPPVRTTEKEAVSDAIIASTAAIIGLLIIILVVLVVVIFKYRRHQKGKQGEAPKTVEAEYENVVGGSNDPEYEEIDIQERGIQMKENEAYASANMPTEPNVAYALVRN